MADGSYRWQGFAPEPDPARVEAIEAACDAAGAADFAEPARAAALDRLDAALAAARDDASGEAGGRVTEARDRLLALDPGVLEPRRGLFGLFDSRKRRLRDFRDAYRRAAADLTQAAGDLSAGAEATARRSAGLDAVWTEIRDALVELDAHRLAARRRLDGQSPATEEGPHPLAIRMEALDACRAAALAALPLIRGVQNADARGAEAMKACANGLEEWRQSWLEALGLAGKRPKKVRPDRAGLLASRDAAAARLERAMTELGASRDRRAQVIDRLAALRAGL